MLLELKEEETHAMFSSQRDPSIKRQFLNGLGKFKHRKEAREAEHSWLSEIGDDGYFRGRDSPPRPIIAPHPLSPLPQGYLNAHG